MKETKFMVKAEGFVQIRDADTRELLADVHNDIHLENFSEALALSLGNYDRGVIEYMYFGSGGSTVDLTGSIDYNDTNVVGRDADIYGSPSGYKYGKVVNDRSANFDSDPDRTNVKVRHIVGTTYSDVIVTCTLEYGEPQGQAVYDDADTSEGDFIFDEVGLKSYDAATDTMRLLTHVIFHPIQKSLNRALEIVYTIRITMMADA